MNRVFHFCNNDANSIYSEPVHKLDAGDLDSACSEPVMFYNKAGPRIGGEPVQRPTELGNRLESIVVSGATKATVSVHSKDALAAGGAAASNLQDLDLEYPFVDHPAPSSRGAFLLNQEIQDELAKIIPQAPIVEPYDSGHDSTPRTSKHSGFSRRAESGYHSISVTVHDESEVSSLKSTTVSHHPHQQSKREKRLLCLWLRNPFNCTAQTETEGEISDF